MASTTRWCSMRLRAFPTASAASPSPTPASRRTTLREWHTLGMRGLRFHLFPPGGKPAMVRGVGLDVFEVFRPVMRELGWIMQTWCDYRVLPEVAGLLREIAARCRSCSTTSCTCRRNAAPATPASRRCCVWSARAIVHVKLSAPYRLSQRYPGLWGRAAVPRGAAARQSGAAALGHRLAASADRRRADAGRRPARGFVSPVDAEHRRSPAHPGGHARASVRSRVTYIVF